MILEEIVKLTDLLKRPQTNNPQSLEARFVAGDMTAMEEIMLALHKSIYQLGLRLFGSRDKAADFYQDVFIKVYEKRGHYHPNRPLKPWLYQVAINLGRDQLRRKQEIIMDEKQMPEPVELPQAEDKLMRDELKQKVWQVLEQMKSAYREIIALRFASDLNLKEIASVLGISLAAAKVRLCRGLKAFEDAFCDQGGEKYVL